MEGIGRKAKGIEQGGIARRGANTSSKARMCIGRGHRREREREKTAGCEAWAVM